MSTQIRQTLDTFLREHQFDRAARHLARYIETNPESSEAAAIHAEYHCKIEALRHLAAGNSYKKQGRNRHAYDEYTKAIELDGTLVEAKAAQAEIRISLDHPEHSRAHQQELVDEAEDQLVKATRELRTSPNVAARRLLRAKENLERVLEYNAHNARAQRLLEECSELSSSVPSEVIDAALEDVRRESESAVVDEVATSTAARPSLRGFWTAVENMQWSQAAAILSLLPEHEEARAGELGGGLPNGRTLSTEAQRLRTETRGFDLATVAAHVSKLRNHAPTGYESLAEFQAAELEKRARRVVKAIGDAATEASVSFAELVPYVRRARARRRLKECSDEATEAGLFVESVKDLRLGIQRAREAERTGGGDFAELLTCPGQLHDLAQRAESARTAWWPHPEPPAAASDWKVFRGKIDQLLEKRSIRQARAALSSGIPCGWDTPARRTWPGLFRARRPTLAVVAIVLLLLAVGFYVTAFSPVGKRGRDLFHFGPQPEHVLVLPQSSKEVHYEIQQNGDDNWVAYAPGAKVTAPSTKAIEIRIVSNDGTYRSSVFAANQVGQVASYVRRIQHSWMTGRSLAALDLVISDAQGEAIDRRHEIPGYVFFATDERIQMRLEWNNATSETKTITVRNDLEMQRSILELWPDVFATREPLTDGLCTELVDEILAR